MIRQTWRGAFRLATFLIFIVVGLLQAQDWDNIQAERVATGLQYADGMTWARAGFLVFGDVVRHRVYRLDPGVPPKPTPASEGGAQGFAYDSQARLYMCELVNRRLVRMDTRGKTEPLAESFQGKKLNSPNDVVVRKDGNVYFTDPAFGGQQDHRELDFYGVYHVPPKGPMKLVAKSATRPNGVALSPNGRILYVVNSDERNVRAYDLDKVGDTSNERIVIANIPSVPGGLRPDAAGNLYIAGKGVHVYSADGKLIHTIELSHPASNCAFGEVDGQTLFITAGSEVHRARFGVKGAY